MNEEKIKVVYSDGEPKLFIGDDNYRLAKFVYGRLQEWYLVVVGVLVELKDKLI